MCGIVGYISTKAKLYPGEKRHFMRFALALDTLRGTDSTGLMTVDGNYKVFVSKTLMPGDSYVNSSQFRKDYRNGWASFGHNRAATVGKPNIGNAHPFIDGPITLVHNGTLWAAGKGLPLTNPNVEVDSAQIAHNLAAHKPEEAKSIIEELDGAYTLVWFDERDKSVNMCRNDERPMSFTVNRDKDIIWFMSDALHLHVINNSMKNRTPAVGTCIYKLEKNKLLKWKRGSLVPEVAEFSPFSYAQRAQRAAKERESEAEKSSGSDDQLAKATGRWKRQLEAQRGQKPSSVGFSGPRVKLGGMVRKVPEPMLDALKAEYDLDPTQFMQFIPDASTPFGEANMVWGNVIYEEWGDSVWKAVVMDAKTLQVNAYKDQAWVVQPIGICHPWDNKTTCPAILCSLVHCDWDGYYQARLKQDVHEAQAEGKVSTGDEEEEGTWVVGPDRLLVSYKSIAKRVESGCVSCGSSLTVGELERCIWVNNNQDILCGQCIEDFQKAPPHSAYN